ncbi:MAG: hypothetical protein KF690_07040 [Bacteroidetes bacterium]|nr:hypothetical protein [Bacteroidota bacterium]
MTVKVSFAQHVGINTATPDPSAVLELKASDAGFLPPRLTTAQRNAIASPAEGLIIYNLDTRCLNFFNGTQWIETCASLSPCVAPPAPAPSYNSPVCENMPLELAATTVAGATYVWTGPNGFYSTAQNPQVTPLAQMSHAGTYSVRAYAAGCYSDIQDLTVTLLPTPWRQLDNFPGGARDLASGFTIGDYGYVGMGRNGCAGTHYRDFYRLDPAAASGSQWVQVDDAPGPARAGAGSFAVGTYGYTVGGLYNNCNTQVLKAYRFDPSQPPGSQWSDTDAADHPVNRMEAFINLSDGTYGYYGLGRTAGANVNDFRRYDPVANNWTTLTAYPGNISGWNAAFHINGRLYVGLGERWMGGTASYNSWYEYNPAANTWAAKTSFPGPAGSQGAYFAIGDYGYVMTQAGAFWQFDPSGNAGNGSWVQLPCNYPGTSAWNIVGLTINGKGYIINTRNGAVWEFTP